MDHHTPDQVRKQLVDNPVRGRRWIDEHLAAEPDWRELALCAETDPDQFFPDQGRSTRNAKAICARCDVWETCLAWSIQLQQGYGVWGGLAEGERRPLIARLNPRAPGRPATGPRRRRHAA